jgi:hypothetical protein
MLYTPILSESHVADFRRNSYVIVRGGFQPDDIARIEAWATEITSWPEEPGRHWVYHEKSLLDSDTSLINRIENMTPFHDGFRELAKVLEKPVGQLLGEDAVLFKDKINFKGPGGDGFKPHQDLQAGWENYASYFVSVLVCIDPATIENGCLKLASIDSAAYLGNDWEPLDEKTTAGLSFIDCPTEPGDIVFFDSYTPHASEPNLTNSTRRLYFATYNRLSEGDHLAAYYADKHKSYPPDIEREDDKEYVFRV